MLEMTIVLAEQRTIASPLCRGLVAGMLACLLLACMQLAFPLQAQAFFNDQADSYPAAQDLGSLDAPIYGNQLPDGAYQVVARTSSRMCIMYTDPTNAEARASKEQAIVVASGGSLTAVFYVSKAYTHLYLGTQEEAAAATNEDGTDASAYIAGNPDDGYVPHYFELPISALNEPMTISTYSGGDKGLDKGKWYTREVVFAMTEAELQDIVNSPGSGADDPAKDQGSNEGQGSQEAEEQTAYDGDSDDGGENPDDSIDGTETVDADEDGLQVEGEDSANGETSEEDSGDEDGDSDDGESGDEVNGGDGEKQEALSEDNVVASGEGDDSGQGGGQGGSALGTGQGGDGAGGDGGGEGEGGPGTATGGAASTSGLRGVRMNITSPVFTIDVDDIEVTEPEEQQQPLLTPQQVFAFVFMALLVLGIIVRGAVFARGYERPTKGPDPPDRPLSFMSRFGWGG